MTDIPTDLATLTAHGFDLVPACPITAPVEVLYWRPLDYWPWQIMVWPAGRSRSGLALWRAACKQHCQFDLDTGLHLRARPVLPHGGWRQRHAWRQATHAARRQRIDLGIAIGQLGAAPEGSGWVRCTGPAHGGDGYSSCMICYGWRERGFVYRGNAGAWAFATLDRPEQLDRDLQPPDPDADVSLIWASGDHGSMLIQIYEPASFAGSHRDGRLLLALTDVEQIVEPEWLTTERSTATHRARVLADERRAVHDEQERRRRVKVAVEARARVDRALARLGAPGRRL